MEPETDQQREAREARLKQRCEELGLVVAGHIVVAPLLKPVAVDASCIDENTLVAGLMCLAFQAGERQGREALQGEINNLLGNNTKTPS